MIKKIQLCHVILAMLVSVSGYAGRSINLTIHNKSHHAVTILPTRIKYTPHYSDCDCRTQTDLGQHSVIILPGMTYAAIGSSHHFYRCKLATNHFDVWGITAAQQPEQINININRDSYDRAPTGHLTCKLRFHAQAKVLAQVDQCYDPAKDFTTAVFSIYDK